jgi:hypothetical protein
MALRVEIEYEQTETVFLRGNEIFMALLSFKHLIFCALRYAVETIYPSLLMRIVIL